MYCRNCGNKLDENDLFCKTCGINTGAELKKNSSSKTTESINTNNIKKTISTESKNNKKSDNFYGSLLSSVIIVFTIFLPWIKFDVDVYYREFSILNIYDGVMKINKYIDSKEIMRTKVLLFIEILLAVSCIIFLLLFIYKLLTDIENSLFFGICGMNIAFAMLVYTYVILCILIYNSTYGRELFYSEILHFTIYPYITTVSLFIGKFIFIKKLKEEIGYINRKYIRTSTVDSYKIWFCDNCNTRNDSETDVCKMCRKKRSFPKNVKKGSFDKTMNNMSIESNFFRPK